MKLPTLAERRGDLVPAARALLREAGGPAAFTPAAQEALRAHPFRGNFRELENVVRRAALEARAAGAAAVDEPHLGLLAASEPEALLEAASRSGLDPPPPHRRLRRPRPRRDRRQRRRGGPPPRRRPQDPLRPGSGLPSTLCAPAQSVEGRPDPAGSPNNTGTSLAASLC